MTEAWLHRRGKPTWHFTPKFSFGGLCHVTHTGTVYKMTCQFPYEQFVIGRLDNGQFIDVTAKLHSVSIEFADGGVYTFPKR